MGTNLAILIGVAKYDNEDDLPPCINDVNLISKIIEKSEKYNDILVLKDKVNSIEANEKITQFIRKHQDNDIDEVFFYYSGHGTRNTNDFLYLFTDFSNSSIKQTSITNNELDIMLKSLNPKVAIKIVDACKAGTEYIKGSKDLDLILKKSASDSFNKTYFLFSSSNSQSSIAFEDFSVFTKSFASSLLKYEGKNIRYRDIMAYISDDTSVTTHQTPLFIQQADNIEFFCEINSEILQIITTTIEENINELSEEKSEITEISLPDNEISLEEKIILQIKQKSNKYSDEDTATQSLNLLKTLLQEYKWNNLLSTLFDNNLEIKDDYDNLNNIKGIAEWLSKNDDEMFFAKVTFEEESYIGREKVQYEDPMSRFGSFLTSPRKIEYKDVKKYRDVATEFYLTAASPFKYALYSFEPNELALPWLQVFITFIFSKNKLVLFYKYELEKEVNWKSRYLLNENEWKIRKCVLNDHNSIKLLVKKTFSDLEESILKRIISRLEISIK